MQAYSGSREDIVVPLPHPLWDSDVDAYQKRHRHKTEGQCGQNHNQARLVGGRYHSQRRVRLHSVGGCATVWLMGWRAPKILRSGFHCFIVPASPLRVKWTDRPRTLGIALRIVACLDPGRLWTLDAEVIGALGFMAFFRNQRLLIAHGRVTVEESTRDKGGGLFQRTPQKPSLLTLVHLGEAHELKDHWDASSCGPQDSPCRFRCSGSASVGRE
jgi:hypothetical protein